MRGCSRLVTGEKTSPPPPSSSFSPMSTHVQLLSIDSPSLLYVDIRVNIPSVLFTVRFLSALLQGSESKMREAAIQLLLESFHASVGKEVKERVRLKSDGTPRTLNSFNSELSVIRCEVYKRFEPTIDDSLREIAESADVRLASGINAFLAATLRDKVRVQRAHAEAPSWPAEVESALSRCRLLPAGMAEFTLTKDEEVEFKRGQAVALVKKNKTLLHVDAGQLMERATAVLDNAANQTLMILLAALLVVSGRRTVELINGKSVFRSADDKSHDFAWFRGQAKKRGAAKEYLIPLMVSYTRFMGALNKFRDRQGNVSAMTNLQVKKKWAGQLNRVLKKRSDEGGALPCTARPHDLRSIYVSLVQASFTTSCSFAALAMAICGHERIGESLSYGNVRLTNTAALEKRGDLELEPGMGEDMGDDMGDDEDDADDADTGAEDDESVEIEPGMGEDTGEHMGGDEDDVDGGDVGGTGADADTCTSTLPVLGGGGAGHNWRPVRTITKAVDCAHNPLSKSKSSLQPKKRPRCS